MNGLLSPTDSSSQESVGCFFPQMMLSTPALVDLIKNSPDLEENKGEANNDQNDLKKSKRGLG
jgi:hypothetical protein